MKKYLLIVFLGINGLACSFLARTLSSPAVVPTVALIASPTYSIGLIEEGIYCSSDVKEARDAYNLGQSNDLAGNYEQAIEYYEQAVTLDPAYCDAMDNLGLNLKRLGRIEESIDWYLRSINVMPTNDVAYLGLANAYRQLQRYEDAVSAYEKLVDIAPENPEGYFGLGMMYYDAQKYQDSIENLKEAERLYREQNSSFDVDAQLFIGYDYFLLGDMENAVHYLEQAYPAYKDDSSLNYYLGYAYYLESPARDLVKAKQYLGKARDLGYSLGADLDQFVDQP